MSTPRKSSSFEKACPGNFIALPPDQLVVGMYVDLNCSWFKHPFPKKSFKIANDGQLATIKSLQLKRVLVDPHKSDPTALGHSPDRALLPIRVPREGSSSAAEYCETLPTAEQTYINALEKTTHAIRDIIAGSEQGLVTAKETINAMGAVIASAQVSTIASQFAAQKIENINVLHALNVSTLSMIVGRQLDVEMEDLKMIGLAGLLHDIGEQRLPVRIKRNLDHLSKLDQQEYYNHPQYSADILKNFSGIPEEVLGIIRYHHVRLDGSGYPRACRPGSLSPSQRIVMVVDAYDSMINHPDSARNLTPSEAVSTLYATSKTAFPEEVIVALIQTLSVYPPGTIVELSDGTIGLVLSLNWQARMRPVVLLNDPGGTKTPPDMVDLSKQRHLSIVRSLAKPELPPKAAEYLNLRRWTAYFVESGKPSQESTASP
jgi:HD-GYP domain-containing protein (c-di-GMP phosphodiesterase class II)